jgi:hypothetical protein
MRSYHIPAMDDTFVIWTQGKEEQQGFLQHLKNTHPKIKPTMESEKNDSQFFLAVLVSRMEMASNYGG